MTQTAPETPTLTKADRCDRCGAQAFVRAQLAGGFLYFCAHHGAQYAPKLAEIAIDIQDESGAVAS